MTLYRRLRRLRVFVWKRDSEIAMTVRAISYRYPPCRFLSGHNRNPLPYPSHISNPSPHQIFHLPLSASQHDIKSRYFDLVRLHHPDSSHTRTRCPPLSPDITHARFRAIKAAYDFLSGKTRSPHPNARPSPPSGSASNFDPYLHELVRRRRAHHYTSYGHPDAQTRSGESDGVDDGWGPRRGWADGFGAPKDQQPEWNQDGWRERFVLSLGVMALVAGLFPSLPYTLGSFFVPQVSSPPSTSHSIIPDMYRNHRKAASTLSQVRQETRQVGVERRESVRRRVREMKEHQPEGDENKEEKS